MSTLDIPRLPRRNVGAEDPRRIGLWKIGRTIGTGSSGRVRIARNSKTGKYAAVKIVSKAAIDSTMSLNHLVDDSEHNQLSLEREIVVMKLIDHPNIMRLYDVWETSTDLYLILEYVQGGELFEHLCKKGRLPTEEALRYFQQIISAMDYCHKFNIAHRDLKPENILLDEDFNVKIADFGMAAWQANGMLRTSCGSPHYAAPEIVSAQAYNGSAADIWSCGVILHALLAGRLPFDDDDIGVLLEKVMEGVFEMPDDIDPLAQDLIKRMLARNVEDRITMPEVLQHPFYTSIKPRPSNFTIPNLDHIAQPIGSLASIDPDIFANLRTLWHGVPDDEIVHLLRNDEQNWQKGVYHLLVEYRRKHFEDYDDEQELANARRKKKMSKMRAVTLPRDTFEPNDSRPSISSLPPRDDPPTPRRAARIGLRSSSDESLPDRIPFYPSTPAPHPPSPAPIVDLSGLPPLAVPELKDDTMQAFFQQIVTQLNALQARIGAEPNSSDASSNLNLLTEVLADMSVADAAVSNAPSGDSSAGGSSIGTRPLSVRRKVRPPKLTVDTNKENIDNQPVEVASNGVVKKSSMRSNNSPTNKRVQIIEPLGRLRPSKLKKRKVSPTSPAFSDAGSSFTLPSPLLASPTCSSPKRAWFENVFSFKPITYTLPSTRDFYTTRNECRRLLMAMDVRVVLEDSDGLGILKCRLDESRDTTGLMSVIKAAKFRVEVQRSPDDEAASLLLTHEKGSMDSFKEVYKRLRRDWVLDDPGAPLHHAIVASPVRGAVWVS
ncbi:CAMK/CAMKL/GIN4 protein kinase [Favolaschia claudopus]|uniref:non-specific serine/threonine protein kinase n=1 Tax=Favolaschia claudopus TaxID=2862362 RepID=A0AAW0AGX3_9AGAR